MQKPSENLFKIGQAAKILNISIDTLRRWEKAGKITSVKTAGGTRFYSPEELNRIKPDSIKIQQNIPLSTEELLKKADQELGTRSYELGKLLPSSNLTPSS